MPEQAALSELVLSWPFKRCQRALAQWLEQHPDAHLSVMATRKTLQTLPRSEWLRLMKWLDCLLYAARQNGEMMMSARIERLTTSLGHAAPPANVERGSVAMTMTGAAASQHP
ncbi:MAG: hypothetical protein WCD66_14620 [Rhodanobacteraceae bacterium]